MNLLRTKPEDRPGNLFIFGSHAMLIASLSATNNVIHTIFCCCTSAHLAGKDVVHADCSILVQTVFAACPANTKVITVIDQDTDWECYCP